MAALVMPPCKQRFSAGGAPIVDQEVYFRSVHSLATGPHPDRIQKCSSMTPRDSASRTESQIIQCYQADFTERGALWVIERLTGYKEVKIARVEIGFGARRRPVAVLAPRAETAIRQDRRCAPFRSERLRGPPPPKRRAPRRRHRHSRKERAPSARSARPAAR